MRAKSGLCFGFGAEEARDRRRHRVDQRIMACAVHQHVVRRDAGLPGIEKLAPDNALGGDLEVRVGRDDAGALAAKLERHGCQVLCGGLHHDAPDARTASEENAVEALGKQRGRSIRTARDERDRIAVHVLRHQRGERLGCVRCQFARLEHGAITRRKRTDQRREQKLHRIVPRRDDQGDAEWLRQDASGTGPQRPRNAGTMPAHPARKTRQGVIDFPDHVAGLGDLGLERGLGEIRCDRRNQPAFALPQKPAQRLKLFAPPRDVAGAARIEGAAQPGDETRRIQRRVHDGLRNFLRPGSGISRGASIYG